METQAHSGKSTKKQREKTTTYKSEKKPQGEKSTCQHRDLGLLQHFDFFIVTLRTCISIV